MDQTNLLENITKFNNNFRPRSKEDKDKRQTIFKSTNAL